MGPDLAQTLTHRPRPYEIPHFPPGRRQCHLQRNRRGPPRRLPATPSTSGQSPTRSDIESQKGPLHPCLAPSDPHGLLASYKSPDELAQLECAASKALTQLLTGKGHDYLRCRRVHAFYQSQNAAIEHLLEPVEQQRADAHAALRDDALRFKLAIWGSFVANVILSGLHLFAAIKSGSLSLFTTMADAIFDPLSNLTLILVHRGIRHVDPRRFPSGKARLETVGNIVFCFLMMAVGAILITFSLREIIVRWGSKGVNGFHLQAVIAVSVAFATKLSLFAYCFSLRNRYSQVRIVWQDHRNDLAINCFGILTSVGGAKLVWWIDPLGAIVLSAIICILWGRTAFAEFLLLVGVVASPETQQLITYVSLTHSPTILGLDTVRVYHSGPRLIAEVDVVMDPSTPLEDSHDISESLQEKLEALPNIERAYVHVDHDVEHKPEHSYRKII